MEKKIEVTEWQAIALQEFNDWEELYLERFPEKDGLTFTELIRIYFEENTAH